MTATLFGRDLSEIRRQDYSLDDDQVAIRDTFANFFAKRCTSSRVREVEPLGYDEALWREAAELGVAAMHLSEDNGGVGSTSVEVVLVAEQAGHSAAPLPLAEVAAAVGLLERTGGGALLEAAATGEQIVTLALRPVAEAPRLLPAGAIATAVVALDGDELVLFEREAAPPQVANLASAPLAWWHPEEIDTRTVLASGSEATALHARAVGLWRLVTAAGLVGLSQRAVEDSVEFAKSRQASGVAIGALQGVAHPLVDANTRIAGARALLWRAAWFFEHEPAARPELVPASFVRAADVADFATATALHMQGGFGFTDEADVALFFRRAKGWSVVGHPRGARAEVADLILGEEARRGLQPA